MSSTKKKTALDNQQEDRDCIADPFPPPKYQILSKSIITLRDKTFGQTVEIFPLCCSVYTSYKVLMVALQLLMLERFRIYR
jgi:hypothetical protein